jgi:hypothetical protein
VLVDFPRETLRALNKSYAPVVNQGR